MKANVETTVRVGLKFDSDELDALRRAFDGDYVEAPFAAVQEIRTTEDLQKMAEALREAIIWGQVAGEDMGVVGDIYTDIKSVSIETESIPYQQ